MADEKVANDCRFQWDIHNPILPGKDLEATFFQGSDTVTQWKLTLRPLDRSVEHWRYQVFLSFDEANINRSEIVAETIALSIELGETSLLNEVLPNQHFNDSNWHKCYFTNIYLSRRGTELHPLEIRLDISLPRTAKVGEKKALVSESGCLEYLSLDLFRLLPEEESPINLCPNLYTDLILLPRNDSTPIKAHSYMLHARWNNFFRVHGLKDTVKTNISKDVLCDILKYIYSGRFGRNRPFWRNHDYISELFHVVNRYGLHHLHKVFVKSDLKQYRVTRNPATAESYLYPLNFVNNRHINDAMHIWNVENYPDLTFRLIVRNENQAGLWLSYSLESTSSTEIRANVHLAVIRKWLGNAPNETPLSFHGQDYTMGPNETVGSTCVLFLGCPETFRYVEGENIKFYIQCYLSVTDGTFIDQIRSVDNDALENELVRFGVLSDHMRQLQIKGFGADMSIRSRLEVGGTETPNHLIHKGIFVTRFHDWLRALENNFETEGIPPEIPENPRCILSESALQFVLDFMYTGKVFELIYRSLEPEIREFANTSDFPSLWDLFFTKSMANEGFYKEYSSSDDEDDFLLQRAERNAAAGDNGAGNAAAGDAGEGNAAAGDAGEGNAAARDDILVEDVIGEAIRDFLN